MKKFKIKRALQVTGLGVGAVLAVVEAAVAIKAFATILKEK